MKFEYAFITHETFQRLADSVLLRVKVLRQDATGVFIKGDAADIKAILKGVQP